MICMYPKRFFETIVGEPHAALRRAGTQHKTCFHPNFWFIHFEHHRSLENPIRRTTPTYFMGLVDDLSVGFRARIGIAHHPVSEPMLTVARDTLASRCQSVCLTAYTFGFPVAAQRCYLHQLEGCEVPHDEEMKADFAMTFVK